MGSTVRGQVAWRQTGWVIAAFALLSVQALFTIELNYGPDEPSHLEYLHILAWEHRLPTVAETHLIQHPPPYYVALAVVWRALGVTQRPLSLSRDLAGVEQISPRGVLGRRVLRLTSTLLGCLTLGLLAQLLAELGVPARHQGWLLATLAMNPMLQYISAVVGNEIAAVAWSTGLALVLVRAWRAGGLTLSGAARLGLWVGLGMWVKQTTLFAALPLGVVLWSAGPRHERLPRLLLAGGVLALVGCGWPLYSHHLSGQFFPNYVVPLDQAQKHYEYLHHPSATINLVLTILATSMLPDWSAIFVSRFIPGIVTLLFWLLLAGLVPALARRPGARLRGLAALAITGLFAGIMREAMVTDWRIIIGGRYLLNAVGWILVLLATAVPRRAPATTSPWTARAAVASIAGLALADACWWYLVGEYYRNLASG